MERSYEYNDEIQQPSEGGEPLKVFTSRQEADKAALELSMNAIRKFNPYDGWGYSFNDMFNFCGLKTQYHEILENLCDKYQDSYRSEMDFANCTEQEIELLARAADPPIYFVHQAEMNL